MSATRRGDRDGDRGGLGDAARGDRVGEAVGAVEVGVRRVGDGAVAVVDDRAVGALGDAGDDRRALEVVVGQHVGGDRGVLGRRVAVGDDVVDRGDGDVDRGGLGDAARGDRVGEAVGAVEVGVGRVGDGAVAIVDDRAVGALGDAGHDRRRPRSRRWPARWW